ncbi:MAG: response regulator [Bacteroidota bacterium]
MRINSIYIIDDDSITIFGLRKILAKFHQSLVIQEFGNGKTALEALRELQEQNKTFPEVIFLDINMPVMDGWTFLDEFLKLPNTSMVTIKIITSSIDIRDREKWKSYVTNAKHQIDFITKPIYEMDLQDMQIAS